MRKFYYLLVILSVFAHAQSHRFLYKYDFVPNLKKPDSVRHKIMRLNITKTFSEFLPEDRARQDSVIMKNIALNEAFEMNFSSNTMSADSFRDYQKNETSVFADIGIQQVSVKMNSLPKWNLSPEKKKVGGYNCQKATSNFGGRNWTAWFTNELPFQEGPYIFKNLPGLIVEMQDDKNSHHFLLVANHNSGNEKSNRFVMGNMLTLSEEKFKTAWKKYKENPVPSSLQMQNRGIVIMDSENASANSAAEISTLKKELQNNNNPILLDLY